jgi:hypothetical protein
MRVLPLCVAGCAVAVVAAGNTTVSALGQRHLSVLQRFLARGDQPTVEYCAVRHLEAQNTRFGASAWMDARTEYDRAGGFRFEVLAEGGSAYIRKKVLRAALEGEQKLWAAREPERASLTPDNYTFQDAVAIVDGLAALGVKPRRKDILLVDGVIYVQSDDGELKRIEGRLSKAPSFWTRSVEIRRQYERILGVRVPVLIESVAQVRVAGRSTFRMTYRYESINGRPVI